MYPGDYSKEERLRIRKFCDSLHLQIVCLDCIHVKYSTVGITQPVGPYTGSLFYPNPNAAEPTFVCLDPAVRQARIKYVKDTIDMAVDMGVGKVETFTGDAVSPPDIARNLAIEGVKEVAAYAEKNKVTVSLELFNSLTFGTPDEVIELIDKIGSPYLKTCVDIGHVFVEGRNVPDTIHKLKNYVGNFHVDDMALFKHYHLAVGRGEIDWQACFKAIKDIGYTDSVGLEIYPYALDPMPAVIESYKYLKNCIDNL
jgi:sugar phosphate isomerase/epimerase